MRSLQERMLINRVRKDTGVGTLSVVNAIDLCKQMKIKLDKDIIEEYLKLKYDAVQRFRDCYFIRNVDGKRTDFKRPYDDIDYIVLARRHIIDRGDNIE